MLTSIIDLNKNTSLILITASFLTLVGCQYSGKKETLYEKEKPNIIVVMLDDMGYSDIGSFGSEINTPNLDRMAEDGIRFTQFYNTARCCPSRASLLSGLYAHQAGMGYMDSDRGAPAYIGYLNDQCVTIAELLGASGYRTIMSGKWHLGNRPGANPWERGFHRFYGIPKGGGVYFWPTILDRPVAQVEDGILTQVNPNEDWFSTDAFTDYAVEQIQKVGRDKQPFFLYLPYIDPHFPQQAREEHVQKYLGKYMDGWTVARKRRHEKQIELGIIDEKYILPESQVQSWDQLSHEQKVALDRQMAVYAAQMDNLDRNIGRLLAALEESEQAENTMVLFFSDNGAPESRALGWERNQGAIFGTRGSFGGYATGWAEVSNTPFRLFKMFAHHGGTASPMIAWWPGTIEHGGIRHQPIHIIDIMPTLLALAGVDYPETFNEKPILPLAGISFKDLLEEDIQRSERDFFWEHMGNAGIRSGDWKLVRRHEEPWHLYDLKNDLTETTNLAVSRPALAEKLADRWQAWADSVGVLPW